MNKTYSFLAGVCTGTGLAILLAPKQGPELQSLIAGKTREGAGRVKAQATEFLDSAADLLKRQREGIEQAVNAGRRAYHASVG